MIVWLRRNLFNTWYNGALTVLMGATAAYVAFRSLRFVFVTARWEIIRVNLKTLLVGLFPRDELWRPWIALFLVVAAVALAAGALHHRALLHVTVQRAPVSPVRRWWPVMTFAGVALLLRPSVTIAVLMLAIPACGYASFRFGGRVPVRTATVVAIVVLIASFLLVRAGAGVDDWGGLLLTAYLAVSGIGLSFPFGVLLALGRRSSMPILRAISTAYIELIRGVPLITLLFMGFFVVGLLFPPGADRPSAVLRAVIAFVMFTAAYIAEIVRGGLQAVPRGQIDAAFAVGLTPVGSLRFIVLPQALRAVIPALVGQFITLFKDTSLVAILTLVELLRVAQVIVNQDRFLAQGLQAETLVFASFTYWVVSYTMSKESQRLEERLGVGQR